MPDKVLDIFIDVPRDTAAKTDVLAEFTALRSGISALPVVRVESGRLPPSLGAKAGNSIDIAHLVVTLVPTAAIVTAIARICVERIRAGTARELHLKIGNNELRLRGADPEAQATAIEDWTSAVLGDDRSS